MKIPFNIKYRPQIESGEYKVETRDGLPVRIICWDRKHGYPIVGLTYEKATGCESYVSAYADGTTSANGKMELSDDLFLVTPEEELTEFEKTFIERVFHQKVEDLDEENKEIFREDAHLVLDFAREQLIKDGYVIEKKAFHDAVKNVPPEVMKEVSDNVDKENELAKKYREGYTKGYKDAEKFYNDFVPYRNPEPALPGVGYKSPRLTDILITPNTASGTSTSTLQGNTSATDGKEHNQSFTD